MTKMISRILLIALCSASALAGLSPLAPATVVGDNSDCALYLNGPGRTSAYDYSINLLKGNFGYEGQPNCITFEAIDQAYLEARNRILVSQPKGDWGAEDFGSVGELILDISINIARRYGLTYEEIEKALPLIDTSRTLIREVCPPVFSHVECRAGKYRRLDGLCNNLRNPTWGATMAPFQRLIGPLFADGINSPRIAHHGRDLPLSRVVSRTMHPDEGFHDHAGTVMVIAWGQFMDHDYTLTGTPLDPINRNDPEECCKRPLHLKHPYCNEIRIPDDDYFYRLFGVKCIDFVRAFPSPRPGCKLGSRNPFNTLTGVIDGNTVYGVTEKFARKLRTGFGGLLRMNPVFKEYGLKDLLPLKLDIPDEGCTRPNKNMYCFEAGEIRVNEQLVLTVMHTLMAREHNRVANALAEVNPHWDDETLFQEARRINIAEIQHITYNEFLPILLGKDVMEKFGLTLEKEGYWDGYDPEVNPDVIASFAAAAYRFGHSLLPTAVERWSKAHKFIASKRLSDLIRRPYDLYRAGVLDEYVMGLMNQVAQAMDDSITQEVTNHLFKKVGARFGMDLVSFNMQRGREFGLPGYMEFRKFCGLPHAESFADLFGSMPNQTVQKYETIFDHPIDVDLWSGGVSERPLPGSMLGPTFACIIATQFSYSRRGDRFWFELPNQPSSFTPEQMTEIRKSRLARIICDNTDIIDTTQVYPFVLPDHELNPRVPCRSGILPSMDFSKWAEPSANPFHGSAKQFMTNATIAQNSTNQELTTNDTENIGAGNTIINATQAETISNHSNILILNNTDTSSNTENNSTKLNEIQDNDTMLKYVYNKDASNKKYKQQTGHPKNSLKRRKRSPIELTNPVSTRIHNLPVLVNYETTHGPAQAGTWYSPLKRANIIEKSNLADFDVVTQHINPKNIRKYEQNVERTKPDDSSESENLKDNSNRSTEQGHRQIHNNKKQGYGSEEHNDRRRYENDENDFFGRSRKYSDENASNERDSYKGEKQQSPDYNRNDSIENSSNEVIERSSPNTARYSSPRSDSRENSYNSKDQKPTYNSAESNESGEDREERDYTSKKPFEKEHNQKIKETVYFKPTDAPYEAQQREVTESNKPESYSEETSKSSEESSAQSSEEVNKPVQKNQEYTNNPVPPSSKGPVIRDVDLGDFSYETVQVNENGKVVPVKENHENANLDSAVELISPTTFKPDSEPRVQNQLFSITQEHPPFDSEKVDKYNKLVHINDGEVKPVVEKSTEEDIESKEETSTPKITNGDETDSLELVLGVKIENEDNPQNDKIIADKVENGDVKEQFERIPLNYNHSQKNENKDNQQITDTPKEPKEANTDAEKNDGTLETFTPEDTPLDENLNIKFDNLDFTLPEINLPDDILAFTKKHSPFHEEEGRENEERPYQYYGRKENDRKNKNNPDDDHEESDDDHGDNYYSRYYGGNKKKENYKKKQPEPEPEPEDEEEQEEFDENEDLYEKFVRERFGKRDTFEKRSENLEAVPVNPQLYTQLQNILKKTADIDEQAKKSGDPNANYMWTLEYGEKL